MSSFRLSLLICLLALFVLPGYAQGLKIKENSGEVTLSNNYLSVTFDKIKGAIVRIKYGKHSNILGDAGSAYLNGPNFSMNPSTYSFKRRQDDLIEISFDHLDKHSNLRYKLHYVMKDGVSGIYCYLLMEHRDEYPPGTYGQTRWGLRASEKYFDYHLVRDSIQGPMPAKADLDEGEKIQDWTFKMDDGNIYTKYDYADYIDGRHVHGMAGQSSGLGMFTIQASHEYLNGGPTKQYQNVHAGPFLINMFKCGHFLSDLRDESENRAITGSWKKLHGPFLLYLNSGKGIAEIWQDAKVQAEKERAQWPYSWMQHADYPLTRGTVKGQIVLAAGKKLANSTVLLAQPGDWQSQSLDYLFSGKTDGSGNFSLNNVRPGTYTLYAFGANIADELSRELIEVKAGEITDLKKIEWTPESNGEMLWQIGLADRRTTGFKLSDHKREYGLFELPPANLTFRPGQSKENEDWFYAQTKRGSWDIEFINNKTYLGQATLTFGIAGAARSPSLEVWVNTHLVGTFKNLGNDASTYRSAVAGGYYQKKKLSFPSSYLTKGKNTVSLKLVKVNPKGGIMYDTIILECL